MTIGNVTLVVLAVAIGVLIGIWAEHLNSKNKCVGTLYFYEDEPGEPPVMMTELYDRPQDIKWRDYVIFRVSQK
jgi:hypothetical protein